MNRPCCVLSISACRSQALDPEAALRAWRQPHLIPNAPAVGLGRSNNPVVTAEMSFEPSDGHRREKTTNFVVISLAEHDIPIPIDW